MICCILKYFKMIKNGLMCIFLEMCTYNPVCVCHLLLLIVQCVQAVGICMCFLFTVQRRWMSFVTSTWVTDHSHCQSGRGRTLCAGYDRGS